MVSFFLFLGVLLCQGIAGYWAFHVSAPNSIRSKIIFALIILLGIGLAVGAHFADQREAQTEASNNQTVIMSGITQIQTEERAGFAQLQSTLPASTVPAEVAVQPPPLLPLPHARIVVSKFTVTQIPNDPDGAYGVQLYMKNDGTAPGYVPLITSQILLVDPNFAIADFEKIHAGAVVAAIKGKRPSRIQQMEPGTENWIRLWKISASDWQLVLDHKKILCLWTVLSFAEDGLGKKDFWISEFSATEDSATDYTVREQKTYLHRGS